MARSIVVLRVSEELLAFFSLVILVLVDRDNYNRAAIIISFEFMINSIAR